MQIKQLLLLPPPPPPPPLVLTLEVTVLIIYEVSFSVGYAGLSYLRQVMEIYFGTLPLPAVQGLKKQWVMGMNKKMCELAYM